MTKRTIKTPCAWRTAASCGCLLLSAGCSSHDDVAGSDTTTVPISFSTDVAATRAATIESTEDLQNLAAGIGVFAYLTDEKTWSEATTGTEATEHPVPDYMYNQQVTWGVLSTTAGGEPVKGWVYAPPKYWPNSSGNRDPRYISFFAYAPWTDDPETNRATYGIVEMPNAGDKRPHLKFSIAQRPGITTDLLYAEPAIDARRNGQGLIEVSDGTEGGRTYTYQKVPLTFHHALACVEIYIQRIYDEPHYSGKEPDTTATKLFVSRLELASTEGIGVEGILDLGPWDGTNGRTRAGEWRDLKPAAPEGDAGTAPSRLIYDEGLFIDSISGTASARLDSIASYELYKWEKEGFGIDSVQRCLFKEGHVFFIPQQLTLTPTLTYSMVTRDDDLQLSDYTDLAGHKYSRIVHTVAGNPLTLSFQKGKRYRLLIHVEAEHIRFELLSVTDWDFPMRFDPEAVPDFNEESHNHELNEKNP